jgi:hypothetical protein
MLMFGEVSNTLTFSCGWDIPILYQGVSLLITEYYDIQGPAEKPDDFKLK